MGASAAVDQRAVRGGHGRCPSSLNVLIEDKGLLVRAKGSKRLASLNLGHQVEGLPLRILGQQTGNGRRRPSLKVFELPAAKVNDVGFHG